MEINCKLNFTDLCCPSCKSINQIHLPEESELNISSAVFNEGELDIRFKCQHCQNDWSRIVYLDIQDV